MFRPVSAELEFVAIEEAELARWKANNVFERSHEDCERTPSPGSSTRVRRRRTASRACTTCGRASTRTSSVATRRCRVASWRAAPAGTRTACRSRSRSKSNSASRGRRRSRRRSASTSSPGSAASRCSLYVDEFERLTERIGYWIDMRARLLHVPPVLRGVRLVAPEAALRARTPLRGPEGHSVLPALRDRPVVPRAWPARGLHRRDRRERLRAARPHRRGRTRTISGARRTWPSGRRRPGRCSRTWRSPSTPR